MAIRLLRSPPVAAFLIAACSGSAEEGVGVPIDSLPLFVAAEQVRIGSVDDNERGFSRIGGVVVDSEGFVYVLEAQDLEIRVYDQQGIQVRTIGGPGEGPGEFRIAHLIGIRGDTLAVSDRRLARVSLFSRSGDLIQTLQMPLPPVEPLPGLMLMTFPARFWGAGFAAMVWGVMESQDAPSDSFWMPHLAFDRSGKIMDTVRLERWAFSPGPSISVAGHDVSVPTGPSARPLFVDGESSVFEITWAVAADNRSGTFTITRTGERADTVFHTTMQYEPIGFPESVVEGIVGNAVRSRGARVTVDSAILAAALREALELPPWQPPVSMGRVGVDGELWLRLHDDGTDDFKWIVLNADGSPRGSVKLTRRATIHWSRGNELWVAEPDSLDVPWLIKYQLRPALG
jgi:hypothetical protein